MWLALPAYRITEQSVRELKCILADDWTGRTVEYHRVQIRAHLGFRECSVADAEKLTAYLAEHVAHKERRPEQVRVELLGAWVSNGQLAGRP
ncbi:hypothetical protein NRF20_44235 [Streptomyces sp. R-74717]|uniref:hypothetical protein n=1 Tax=Streptomyces TaxID=1883 RepID=UPI0037B97B16